MTGSIENRGKNSWRLSVYTDERLPSGKFRRLTKTVKATGKREANKLLAEFVAEVEGQKVSFDKITVEQAAERWLAVMQATRAWNTYNGYQKQTAKHILPVFGQRQLKDITSMDVETHLLEKAESISATTAHAINAAWRGIFNYGIRQRLIYDNPCDRITLPKKRRKKTRPEDVYSPEEVRQLESYIAQEQYGIFFFLALETGMRPQEILALRWDNVDWFNRSIVVMEAVKRYYGKVIIDAPKSDDGVRVIRVRGVLLERLKVHRAQQSREKLIAGSLYQDAGLVVANSIGGLVKVDRLGKVMARICKKAGVRKIPLYHLRHTHATLLLTAGVNIRTLADRLGHSDTYLASNTYAAVMPSSEDDAVGKLGDILGDSPPKSHQQTR